VLNSNANTPGSCIILVFTRLSLFPPSPDEVYVRAVFPPVVCPAVVGRADVDLKLRRGIRRDLAQDLGRQDLRLGIRAIQFTGDDGKDFIRKRTRTVGQTTP
jgi:hypothetical protein